MSSQTPNLALPYILPAQAQKHVTHNEALQIIDGAANLSVAATLSSPPPSPGEGALYLIESPAADEWAGKQGKLAMHVDGAWTYLSPRAGWAAWFAAARQILVFDGADWINPMATGALPMLGINAAPDATARLALSADASLFNNAGAGHQIKVNKAAAADTVSLIFQTAWSGRAEIGLAGSDLLQIKTSPDGASWSPGLTIDGNGVVRMPSRPIACGCLDVGTISPSSGDMIGLGTLSMSQGGLDLGDALASGYGHELVVPASGHYAIQFTAVLQANSAFTVGCAVNGSAVAIAASGSAATSDIRSWHAGGIAYLDAGDAVTLKSVGSISIQTGWNSLTMSVAML